MLLAIAVVAGAVVAGSAWFGDQMERRAIVAEVSDVARAAESWWLNKFGYEERVEFRCVSRNHVPVESRTHGCSTTDTTDTTAQGVPYEPAPATRNATAFVVFRREAGNCAAAVADANLGTTDDINGAADWGVFLEEPLNGEWTLRLFPGRITGELRHADLHGPDDAGFPWAAPVSNKDAPSALFEDMQWMAFGGEELHVGRGMSATGQQARSCLGAIRAALGTTP